MSFWRWPQEGHLKCIHLRMPVMSCWSILVQASLGRHSLWGLQILFLSGKKRQRCHLSCSCPTEGFFLQVNDEMWMLTAETDSRQASEVIYETKEGLNRFLPMKSTYFNLVFIEILEHNLLMFHLSIIIMHWSYPRYKLASVQFPWPSLFQANTSVRFWYLISLTSLDTVCECTLLFNFVRRHQLFIQGLGKSLFNWQKK